MLRLPVVTFATIYLEVVHNHWGRMTYEPLMKAQLESALSRLISNDGRSLAS